MDKKKSFDFERGEVLLIDKPYEWTSFDVVKKLRGAIRIKKIGHAGTLDPLATGLLIVCVGRATKKINEFQNLWKEYEGTLELGKTTPSFDLETAFDSEKGIQGITQQAVLDAAGQLTGQIMQVPPVYSAIKIKGKRAYEKARKKEDVVLEARPVQVDKFDLPQIELPRVNFDITCSKGTYIRSMVRDLGEILGCGAYMSGLRRTAIGPHKVSDAYSIDEFINLVNAQPATD